MIVTNFTFKPSVHSVINLVWSNIDFFLVCVVRFGFLVISKSFMDFELESYENVML